MDARILEELSVITEEERELLRGREEIDRTRYMETTRDVVNAEKLLRGDRLISMRPHTRFVHFPEHSHDYVEMVYMCQGSTTHLVNGDSIELRSGELLILGQNARQEILPCGEADIAVNIIVAPAFFGGTLSFMDPEDTPLRRFLTACLSGNGPSSYLLYRVSEVVPVQNLMENLLWTMVRDTPNRRSIQQLTMGLLFTLLPNYADRLSTGGQDQDLVLRTLHYIESHYADAGLNELAAELHYSPAWISREIHRLTGRTYTELLQEKRLSQALWMLRHTEAKVGDIVAAVGYDNPSYFHRIFLRRYGLTPRAARLNK